jgi:hypothetical protein
VRYVLHQRRARALIALILVPAFCVSPSVSAEIFKCVAKDGSPLYQNFPCQFDSIGWKPSNADGAKTTSASTNASQAKPKSASVNVASANTSEPRVGMTTEEVRALLGEPEEMVEDEPASGGRVSNWRYADGRIVQFDHKHQVLGVQR